MVVVVVEVVVVVPPGCVVVVWPGSVVEVATWVTGGAAVVGTVVDAVTLASSTAAPGGVSPR